MEKLATVANRRGERGQAIVEMALTLPLLLVTVLGIFDFGLMFQKFEVVTNAAREGARVGVLPEYTAPTATNSPNARLRALDYLAVGGLNGTIRGSITDCTGGLAPGQRCVSAVVSDTTITGSDPPMSVRQVTVTATLDYQYRFVGPILNLFGGSLGTTRLQSVSTMRME